MNKVVIAVVLHVASMFLFVVLDEVVIIQFTLKLNKHTYM